MKRLSNGVLIAWIGTICWIAYWLSYGKSNYQALAGMEPSEWGDLFAGLCAPLAFGWLILGYYQQGRELSNNTAALKEHEISLRAQADSLSALAKATSEQVAFNEKQAEIYSRSIQPLFKIEAYPQTNKRDQVTIHHHGKEPIYSLEIKLTESELKIHKPLHTAKISFDPGEKADFVVESESSGPIEFMINYLDANQLKKTVKAIGRNKRFEIKRLR